MERNTYCILDALTIGDRFFFRSDNTKTVYQITGKENSSILYNLFVNNKPVWNYDKARNENSSVKFLRHAKTKVD